MHRAAANLEYSQKTRARMIDSVQLLRKQYGVTKRLKFIHSHS